MKLKPGSNSNELLGMTRSEAKMYEYDVPNENRIHINKEKIKDLFFLTIALLGDYAVGLYKDNNTSAILNELKENLIFSAQFFDAYFNAKLQDKDYYVIMGSAAYYLCDYMGSAKVFTNKLKSDELNLDVNKLDLLLLNFLKNDFSAEINESVYITYINNIISSWNLFCSTGENSENIFQNLNNLRKEIYENGTDRELLFIDILCAVVKKKHLYTTWHTMPLFTDIDKEIWKPILTKISIKELWPSQILIGKNEIFKGKSATIQMPTSAGKTKATELIIRSAFLADRTNLAVIVAPFKALCHDIQDDLQKAFYGENIDIDELSDVYQVDYELDSLKEQKKILVLTPEKLLYILRQTPELAQEIGLIIYDEGHQFDSPSRGTNYELLLASLKSMLPEHCQTILISAVIENNEIIWGQQIEMGTNDKNGYPILMSDIRIPINANLPIGNDVINDDMQLFKFYASMHYTIFNAQKKNIMPTFIIVYEDNTVSYISFIPTIKTTFYRKAQYVEKIARKKDIRVIYFIGENYYYPIEKIKEIQQSYSQRIKHASTTLLSINMMSKKYEHIMTIIFDTKNIECEAYAINQINNPYEDINCHWLNPILDILKEKNLSKY